MYKLVLIRHGESLWNKENRFTGWHDVDLSAKGIEEAHEAAQTLKSEHYTFDFAYSSYLKRAIKTLNLVLEDLDLLHIPVQKAWQLNERHYGSLQGLNKKETAEKYGDAQVHIWRRSFDTPPPALAITDSQHPSLDPKYAGIDKSKLPGVESLKTTIDRVLPFWHSDIVPQIKSGKKIIIGAHGNSIRALMKYLDHISDEEIAEINIPTAVPLVYELDKDMKPITHYYLGDAAKIAEKVHGVANQAKSK